MNYYWESTHFTKKLGDHVLDKIFNFTNNQRGVNKEFGVKLTRESIKLVLDKIRNDQIIYEVTHPSDLKEIRELAAKTEKYRPIKDFSDYMAGEIANLNVSLSELSATLGLSSVEELDKLFLSNYGYKASEYRLIAKEVRATIINWIDVKSDIAYTNLSLMEISNKYGLDNLQSFKDKFKEEFEVTIKEHINSLQVTEEHLKLEQAKILLERTALSIKKISNRLSFSTVVEFQYYFKLKTGVDALVYRVKSSNGKGISYLDK